MIQIFCNKNYKCQKAASDTSISSIQMKQKTTKKPAHTTIKIEKSQSNESVICNQPASFNPSKCKHECHTFEPFSPSFNLKTNKKSTPIDRHQCNCGNIPMKNISQDHSFSNVRFQNTQTQTRSQTNPAHSTPKQTHPVGSMQTETKADIHQNPQNVSSIESFKSF